MNAYGTKYLGVKNNKEFRDINNTIDVFCINYYIN